MASSLKSNPIIIRSDFSIGNTSAEADTEFLENCFVYSSASDVFKDFNSAKMILAGRTGSGKTAILQNISVTKDNVSEINPFDMALNYVANSDIMRFLLALGVDLDLFFQVLWKHVLCIEFIRLRYKVNSEEKSKSILSRFSQLVERDARKRQALAYLEEWADRFWITMDVNIKELTQKVEQKLHAEIGGEIEKFKARANYDKQLSVDRKFELAARAKKIVNSEQLSQLSNIIEILSSERSDLNQDKYYILIDRLDENWVDDGIRFRLIRALVESLKGFRKIINLKIVVALRFDVIERALQEGNSLGFQREKSDDYIFNLKWQKNDIKSVVEKRIAYLFKRKYTMENVGFYDIFPPKIGNQDTFDYIVERTLMRPRDIISFVNQCLSIADGKNAVSKRIVIEAEREYSRIRLQAILDEWRSAFPTLNIVLNMLKGKAQSLDYGAISAKEVIDDIALPICAEQKVQHDPLFSLASDVYGNNPIHSTQVFAKSCIEILYRVGIIGVKFDPTSRFLYSHMDQFLIDRNMITPETRIRTHPMLHFALNISTRAESY